MPDFDPDSAGNDGIDAHGTHDFEESSGCCGEFGTVRGGEGVCDGEEGGVVCGWAVWGLESQSALIRLCMGFIGERVA